MYFKPPSDIKNKTIADTISYLMVIENYIKGGAPYETNPLQQKEDFELYTEAQRLQEELIKLDANQKSE